MWVWSFLRSAERVQVFNQIISVSLPADLSAPGSRENCTQTHFFELLPHTCVFTLNDNTWNHISPEARAKTGMGWPFLKTDSGTREIESYKWPDISAAWPCLICQYCWSTDNLGNYSISGSLKPAVTQLKQAIVHTKSWIFVEKTKMYILCFIVLWFLC